MILITGGTGLLGSRLLYDLAGEGFKIRALKRSGSNTHLVRRLFNGREDLFSRIEWVEGDVLDVWRLIELMKGVEHVYHCAATVSFLPAELERMKKINVEGTANVVNACLEQKVKKLCHVSSIAALGRMPGGGLITEETAWENSGHNSSYAITKYQAEREVWRGMAEGLDAVVVNPAVILGAGDWSDSSARLFRQAWKGIKYYTDGINGFVNVRDVSKAMILLMKSDIRNERFIISSENFSYRDFFNEAADLFGRPRPSVRVNGWLTEIGWRFEAMRSRMTGHTPLITRETARTARNRYFYSNEKIRKMIGMEFIPVKESIKEICAVFLKEQQES